MMHIRACVDIPRQSFVVNPQIVVMVRSIEMLIFVIVYCALTTLKVIPVQGVAAISYAGISFSTLTWL